MKGSGVWLLLSGFRSVLKTLVMVTTICSHKSD